MGLRIRVRRGAIAGNDEITDFAAANASAERNAVASRSFVYVAETNVNTQCANQCAKSVITVYGSVTLL